MMTARATTKTSLANKYLRNYDYIAIIQSCSHSSMLVKYSVTGLVCAPLRLKIHSCIKRLHKWRPKKYSFLFMLIRLTSLVGTDKIQKKCSFRTRVVGLISTKTKEYFFGLR